MRDEGAEPVRDDHLHQSKLNDAEWSRIELN